MLHTTEIAGAAPTVVLLHGVFMDQALWDRVTPLIEGRHIVMVDMPGHGSSAGMGPRSRLEHHVEEVAEALDRSGVGHAVIVGHSWGGMTALRLAARRPDLVSGLVLTNTPLLRTTGTRRVGFMLQRAMVAGGLPLGWYSAAAARALHGPDHLESNPGAAPALRHRLERMGRARVANTIRSVILEPGDALDALAALEMPVMVLGGAQDYALTPAVNSRLVQIGVEPIVTRGGHTGPQEDPAPIAEAIVQVADQARSPGDRPRSGPIL